MFSQIAGIDELKKLCWVLKLMVSAHCHTERFRKDQRLHLNVVFFDFGEALEAVLPSGRHDCQSEKKGKDWPVHDRVIKFPGGGFCQEKVKVMKVLLS